MQVLETDHGREDVGQSARELKHDDDDRDRNASDASARHARQRARCGSERRRDNLRKSSCRTHESVGAGSDARLVGVAGREETPSWVRSAFSR